MQPDHLRDDLKQEVILIICELPEERLQMLVQENRLIIFTARIILNLIKSNTSPFYKKYRQLHNEFIEDYGDVALYQERKEGDFFRVLGVKHNSKAVELAEADDSEQQDREIKELIEDMAIEEIASWENHPTLWYAYTLIQLYKQHGNFRAIQDETGIPFSSCYKTIKKSFNDIKETVQNKPVFSKEELRFIQNNTPKIKL